MISVYGKHPDFGDFISHEVSSRFTSVIVPWVGQIMSETRDYLGPGWDTVYDTALPLRFWIGAKVFGDFSLRGVLYCSRDKVGRRYPLIIVEQDQELPMPLVVTDQVFYETLETRLIEVANNTVGSAGEIIADLGIKSDFGDRMQTDTTQTSFWAANPDPKVDDLLHAVTATDHQLASEGRSYWWTAGRGMQASTFLAAQGVPKASELAWLLSGVSADRLQQPTADETIDIDSSKMESLGND